MKFARARAGKSWPGILGGVLLAVLVCICDAVAADTLSIKTANGEFPFEIEIADDEAERGAGLMFRETMPANHGMLFDFGQTSEVSMWMKNTPMALDMVFLRADGTVASIAERTVPFSLDVISSGAPVSHVLEVRAGVARLIGLKPGDRAIHPLFSPK